MRRRSEKNVIPKNYRNLIIQLSGKKSSEYLTSLTDPTQNFEFIKDARTNDHKCGYTCKERELLKWTKTRKKHIRREDLIANITGKSLYLG